jgi:hypothetical protein
MGQPVAVIEKPSSLPGVVRFETNRSLTGMGHERFRSVLDATQETPAAELARRLFGSGRVDGVHVYANMVTVDLAKGRDATGLAEIVANLYQYWKPGMAPPSFEDFVEAASETPTAGGEVAGGDATLSEAAKRVPAHLLERSRLAREKWKANEAAAG